MSTPDPAEDHPVVAEPAPVVAKHGSPRKLILGIVGGVIVVLLLVVGIPWVMEAINTVSTDDAYVNGHVTYVAPRVGSQVARVLVDDNQRVRKGDLLIELDPAPLLALVNIAQSAVEAAEADRITAEAQARAWTGQTRSLRFNLEKSIEDVQNQIALLRSKVATLASQRATLEKTRSEYERFKPLAGTGAVSPQDLDIYKEAFEVAQAKVEEALQGVYQVRVSLGLPPQPTTGDDLTQVPPDLDQNFSAVRQAMASLMQSAAQLGVIDSFNKTPKQLVEDFYKRDPSGQGDIDRIYNELIKTAPNVKQSEAKLLQATRNLEQAQLNLSYCRIYSEIDGVVTRRNVNPGNNVVPGQSLMAIRSLDEVWIDANFKETQLGSLRIGQPVDLDVDMYGSQHRFKGRVASFTMGTGSTLALLPAENATGNFVKVVQRLPVRIELMDYDPDKLPLFTGLSVTAIVRINETPTGPNAGKVLQISAATTMPATQP